MSDLHVVVLAAGKGTRMKSQLPKVLHKISGLSIIERVIRTAAALQPASITVVVGHGADDVKRALAGRTRLQFVTQEQQLGTGHALLQTRPHLDDKTGTVVLLSGDVPLLSVDSLQSLLAAHREASAAATVITANFPRPFGYGRIVRSNGKISKIVEERDTTTAQKTITEINSGIYAFDLAPLFAALDSIGTANKQGEYYLPDLIAIYRKQKRAIATWTIQRADEIRGINSRSELAEVITMVRQQKNEELMAAGVTLIDPATTYVDADVVIGPDTVIYPCVFLEGNTRIGSACEIHSGTRIVNSTIGDRVCVRNHTVVTDSTVEAGAFLGPFAHIRPDSKVGEDAHVGNFVELKKTDMGKGAKANHLAYLGDATIGPKTNVGAGTITCNYDGEKKHRTVIGAGVFVGSNSTLVAPISLADGSYIAAGSAVTTDVPAGALAIGRARQENKDGWVAKRQSTKAKP
ncbi:MAG TPA: bifunctional UDP-N-acetylglucosamine diphosphorylase/glucosamine-1-phosphate N-acetyltransferase GlmU [Vicinamibacterales bacterium]|nr:bifunctional UDP-N-acetylglucosamine diphosphorylase/glucosamine-1-phosphate N-acetyltransferase GlmU [Vicinamibacterales bacterium]